VDEVLFELFQGNAFGRQLKLGGGGTGRGRGIAAGALKEGKGVRRDSALPARQDDGALHGVGQLPDVARPEVLQKSVSGPFGEHFHRPASFGESVDEKIGQGQDAFPPLPERRHVNGKDTQPVVEVLAELGFAHQGRQVPVGGADDPDVDLDVFHSPHALDHPVLKGPQKLGLGFHGKIAHFVQEKGPSVGVFELAQLAAVRPRESALFMAEQLRFHQARGDGRAIDGHEPFLGPGAAVVDEAGHHLLAHSRFPRDHHRGLGHLRHPVGQLHDFLHGRGNAHHAVVSPLLGQLLAQGHVFRHDPGNLEGLFHAEQDSMLLEGLGEVVHGAVAHGFHGGLHGAESRDENDGIGGIQLLSVPHESQAVHAGHFQIHDEQIVTLFANPLQGGDPVPGFVHSMPLEAQHDAQNMAHLGFVIDHEDIRHESISLVLRSIKRSELRPSIRGEGKPASHFPRSVAPFSSFLCLTGKTRRNPPPPFSRFNSSAEPPCCWRILRTRARPSPVP